MGSKHNGEIMMNPAIQCRGKSHFIGATTWTLLIASTAIFSLAPLTVQSQRVLAPEDYHFYRGNTHAHTSYTSSHGEQVTKNDPSKNGPPQEHHRLAKQAGYDFYITTDHSQEVAFDPTSPTNPSWLDTKQQAIDATDANYVGLYGYEHSENNGPDGKGHYNVINSNDYLDALEPGIWVKEFYKWLKTQPGAVVSFNHPAPNSYGSFAYRDAEVTDIITLLEVINSNKNIHYPAFVAALDKGWKVSPVCGNDNHGLWGITHHTSRTVVLAKAKTKDDILEAMRHRRTYATLDTNLQAKYTVNGAIMGSTLDKPAVLNFVIDVNDPDTKDENDRISKIDIVTDKGAVVQTYTPQPAHAVTWSPSIENTTGKYFFVRIWNAGSPDPVAWLAPVWTGR
jgi:hypothetical protein